MKCDGCKNFKVRVETIKKDNKENNSETCTLSNSVCNSMYECNSGLFDKTGPI